MDELLSKLYIFWITQIQRMVISGGNFKPDTLKPKEVVSLLLDDEEIEQKCKSDSTFYIYYLKQFVFELFVSIFENIVDRQRNEEKRKWTQEENARLEAEKERKRKAVSFGKVSWKLFNLQNDFLCKQLSIHFVYRVTNKSRNSVRISHLAKHRIQILVRRVALQNRFSSNRLTMSRAVKRLLLIVIVYRIRVHKHF